MYIYKNKIYNVTDEINTMKIVRAMLSIIMSLYCILVINMYLNALLWISFHRSLCYEFLSPCFLVASGLFYMFILWINKINWKTWEMWHPICISWIIRGFFLHNYEIKSATPWQENFTTHTLIWEREREGRGLSISIVFTFSNFFNKNSKFPTVIKTITCLKIFNI